MIGHLKAHVYDKVSREIADEAAKDNPPAPPNVPDAVARPSPNPQAEIAANGTDKNKGSAPNDDMLAYIKSSITSLIVSAGGDVSKFKPGNFQWTTLVVILANQGLVMNGWPASVPMPGERGGSKSKGITVLKKGEQRTLCDAFESNEITVIKVQGKAEQRALVNSDAPVIIGAPPPPDSYLENAQCIYTNSTIDIDGPARLPQSLAATRMKCKPTRMPLATASDPIELSSGDDASPQQIDKSVAAPPPARLTGAPPRTKKLHSQALKKPIEYLILNDSSDDAVRVIEHTDDGATVNREEEYQEAGPSRKRKANYLEAGRPAKKPSKGKERAVERKPSRNRTSSVLSGLSDSEEDTKDATVKASNEPVAKDDVFLAPPQARNIPAPVTPSTQVLQGALDSLVPSSPSPKRNARLRLMTAFPRLSPMLVSDDDGMPMPTSPRASSPQIKDVQQPPHAPLPTSDSALSVAQPAPAAPLLTSGSTPSAAQPAPAPPLPPPVPPKLAAIYQSYGSGNQGEWLDQPCGQVGGGGHPYSGQRQYFPYPANSAVMPPHRFSDMPPGMYPENVYRDSQGMYGGFHHREQMPGGHRYPTYIDGPYQALHYGAPHAGPSHLGAPQPGPSRLGVPPLAPGPSRRSLSFAESRASMEPNM